MLLFGCKYTLSSTLLVFIIQLSAISHSLEQLWNCVHEHRENKHIHCITFLTFAHSDILIHGTSMKTLLITKDRQKVVTAKYPSYSLSHRNCIVGRHLTGHNALIDTSYDRVYNNFHKNQQKIMQRCDHCMKISHNVQSVAKNEQHCTQIWQQLKTVPQQDL